MIPRIRFNLSYFPIDFRNAQSKLAATAPAILEIKLLKATGLMAVNSDGKTSDPYFCVEINNRRLYKSPEYQKQLNPILSNEPVIGVLLNTRDLDSLLIFVRDYNAFGTFVNLIIGKMKSMGAVYYNLDSLVRTSENGLPESTCSETWFDTSGDVIFDGDNQGVVHFGLRLRILSREEDQLLRRKKEGDVILVDTSLSIDAKELILLNENTSRPKKETVFDMGSMIGSKAGNTVLDFFASKIVPSKVEDQAQDALDTSLAGVLEIELVKATELAGLNGDNGKT